MKRAVVILSIVAMPVVGSAEDKPVKFNPEGTIRTIISAQAYYKQAYPAKGYACDFKALVGANALKAEVKWTEPLDGYVYRIECRGTTSPQATFRASAVPASPGSQPTLCTDESSRIRKSEGTAETCFQLGVPLR